LAKNIYILKNSSSLPFLEENKDKKEEETRQGEQQK
jgi:hypothetical protein